MVAQLLAAALGLLFFLPALAYATPTDPTWIGGLYDDADYDDIIILVHAIPCPPAAVSVQCPDPNRTPAWLIPTPDEQLPPSPTPPPQLARGPPLSSPPPKAAA
jgi:hypothetical protein